MVWILLVIVVVMTVFSGATYVVPEWQQAIVTQFGNPIRTVRDPGLYWKIPFLQTVTTFDKRVLYADAGSAEYITLDKKRILIDHISRWEIVDPLAFFRTVRDEPGAIARLDDIITGRLRQEVARENFLEIIREKRELIMENVTVDSRALAERFGIHVLDVRVKRADLPTEVQASVFARMEAERKRIALRYRAEGEERGREIRAEADKEREIILARAYQESQGLRGAGDPDSLERERLSDRSGRGVERRRVEPDHPQGHRRRGRAPDRHSSPAQPPRPAVRKRRPARTGAGRGRRNRPSGAALGEEVRVVFIVSNGRAAVEAAPSQIVLNASCRHTRLTRKFQVIKSMIDSGKLGEIYHIHHIHLLRSTFIEWNPRAAWAMDRKRAGGGPFIDWGVYDLSFHLGLLDDLPQLKSVRSFSRNDLRDLNKLVEFSDVEQHGAAWLEFDTGLTYYYERGAGVHGEAPNETRLYGTQGGLRFEYPSWGTNELEFFYEQDGEPRKEILTVDATGAPDDSLALTTHFLDCLEGTARPLMPVQQAAKHLEILFKILGA